MEVWFAGMGVAVVVMGHLFWSAWWASNISSRLKAMEGVVEGHSTLGERLARIEATMHDIRNQLQHIQNERHHGSRRSE